MEDIFIPALLFEDMKKVINISFDFNESIVLKTDPGNVRQISAWLVRPGNITYGVVKGEDESWHDESQIEHLQRPFRVKGFGSF